MVDSVSICMDGALGSDDAASEEYAEKICAYYIYGSVCIAWIRVWDFVCTFPSGYVWSKL